MKNCEPLVSAPELAMASTQGFSKVFAGGLGSSSSNL